MSYINRREYEIRLSLCPPVETDLLVQPQANSAEGQAHSKSPECDSRQAPDMDRLFRQSGLFSRCSTIYAHGGTRQVDLCAAHFHSLYPLFQITNLESGCIERSLGGAGSLSFPSVGILGQVVTKVLDHECHRMIRIAPGWSNMPWF